MSIPRPPDIDAVLEIARRDPRASGSPQDVLDAILAACYVRCHGDEDAAAELYALMMDHADAQIAIEDGEY